jgi:hypothetical protein
MNWIFSAFLVVSILHMVEEYFYPGGFMEVMKHLNPRFAPFVTVPMALIVNGLQLVLCVLAMIVGRAMLTFSVSVAALLFINAWAHILGGIKAKGYVPGVITGLALYLPLSVYAYYLFVSSGQLTLNQVFVTVVLGLMYQAVPIGYFVMASAVRRT